MAGKSPQPRYKPPFQAPIALIDSVEGKIRKEGQGGVGESSKTNDENSSKCLRNIHKKLANEFDSTIHAGVHL